MKKLNPIVASSLRWLLLVPGTIFTYLFSFFVVGQILESHWIPLGTVIPHIVKISVAGWQSVWVAGRIAPKFKTFMSVAVMVALLVFYGCSITANYFRHSLSASEVWAGIFYSACGLAGSLVGVFQIGEEEVTRVNRESRERAEALSRQ